MSYKDIFDQRGSSYDAAMRRWPDPRADDFLIPLEWIGVKDGETLLDLPAGGGYIGRYLPGGCRWIQHEPSGGFSGHASDNSLVPIPLSDASVDCAISIAGVHHLDDKNVLFEEMRRVLKREGRLLLADVHEQSAVARFLDEYVGEHNSTGHQGRYLADDTLVELRDAGFDVVRAERTTYTWRFDDREQLGLFCAALFDMRDVDPDAVSDAVDNYLGISTTDGKIAMNWELFLILACQVTQ